MCMMVNPWVLMVDSWLCLWQGIVLNGGAINYGDRTNYFEKRSYSISGDT